MKVKKKSEQIVKPNWRRWNRSIECEEKKRTTNKKYTRLLPSPPHLIRKQYNIHILTIPTRTVCAVQNAIISSYMLSLAHSVSSFQHFNVLSNSGLSFAIFYCFCFSFFQRTLALSSFSAVRLAFYTFLYTKILLYYCHPALRLCFVCSMFCVCASQVFIRFAIVIFYFVLLFLPFLLLSLALQKSEMKMF